ncbi:MAG: LppX_LprAFG lipoprotein [Actinomycetota bacterium]|nr:LppX_LprAFG lipoprotein [Actinomycetota bacterium]
MRLRPLPPRLRQRPGGSRGLGASLLCALAVLLAVSGCTGGAEESPAVLGDRLRAAKQALDRAASIDLTLRADRLPAGVSGISEASGVATHAPAFRGRITIAGTGLLDGQRIAVVAVGGQVYAQTPFSSSFIPVDPADFNAPDPARLMDPGTGLSTLLTAADGLTTGGEERAGEDVLTAVTGRVPGTAVSRVFPSAAVPRPFDATFWLDGGDRLRRAEVTGRFYGGAPPVTYDIAVQASDRRVQISAP